MTGRSDESLDSQNFESPTFECVLDTMDDDTSSLPPPPPSSGKRRKNRGPRGFLRPTSKSPPPAIEENEDMSEQYQLEGLHDIRENVPEYDEEDSGSVEYSDVEFAQKKSTMNMIPPVSDEESVPRGRNNRGRRRLCMTGALCLLIAGVVLGVVFGMRANDSTPRTTSAGLIDSDAAPSPTEAPSEDPVVVTPVDEGTDIPVSVVTDPPVTDATDPPVTVVTDPPVGGVTDPPVEDPALCEDTVVVDSTCFVKDSIVTVFYSQCDPDVGDWIGIYPESAGSTDLFTPNPTAWEYVCDTDDCGTSSTGTVFLAQRLSTGTYVAHLLRNDTEPYSGYASSTSFEISETC